jgi:hypothetical protein
VLFDITVFGFVLPIGLGAAAVHLGRSSPQRWRRIVGWILATLLGLFVLSTLIQLVWLSF